MTNTAKLFINSRYGKQGALISTEDHQIKLEELETLVIGDSIIIHRTHPTDWEEPFEVNIYEIIKKEKSYIDSDLKMDHYVLRGVCGFELTINTQFGYALCDGYSLYKDWRNCMRSINQKVNALHREITTLSSLHSNYTIFYNGIASESPEVIL